MIEAIRRRENHRRTRSKLQNNLSNAYKAFIYHEPHQRITAYTELCTTVSTFAPQLLNYLAQSDVCRMYSTDYQQSVTNPDAMLFTAEIDKFERVPIWGEYAPHNVKIDRHRHLAGLYFDLALSPLGFGSELHDPIQLADAVLRGDLFFNLGWQEYDSYRRKRTFKRALKNHLTPLDIIEQELFHDTQVASLNAIPLSVWSHLLNNTKDGVIRQLAQNAAYDYTLRIQDDIYVAGLQFVPPEKADLSFLKT